MKTDKLSIYFFSSTHWDREWYQSFQGFRYRLVAMINEMIDYLEATPEFAVFHLDGQTIVLEDYLQIEPLKRDRLTKLIQEGRILIGPWYDMPDEFLISGESLIRNLIRGHKISREFGVEPWKNGYICDIFGHIAQMPQIFKGFGIRHTVLGRGTNEHNTPAHFRWLSPDGSEALTYKVPDFYGYGAFYREIIHPFKENDQLTVEEKKALIRSFIESEMMRSDIPVVVLMDGHDHEWIHQDTPQYIQWIRELYPDAEVKHTNLMEMADKLELFVDQMPVKQGELYETGKIPGDYVYVITHTLSSRYPLKKANDECQTLLEKWIEPLTLIAELQGLSIQKSYVELAYQYLLQNHPHDSICGCSIDQVHKDMEYRFDQTRLIGGEILAQIFNWDKQQYPAGDASGEMILIIWNPLTFPREEVITAEIDFPLDYPRHYQEPFGYEMKNSFKIYDHLGTEIPYGLISIQNNRLVRVFNQTTTHVNRYSVSLKVQIPAMGKAEYKVVPFQAASRYLNVLSRSDRGVESENLQLTINDNGTLKLYDKLGNRTYDSLLGYVDDGEIGDGWYHVNPSGDRLIGSGGAKCIIERIENGPSRTVFQITHHMEVPEEMEYDLKGIRRSDRYTTLRIRSQISVAKGANYVDIETEILNNARDHRVRLMIPTGIDNDTYFVNQPFAFVERKSGVRLETETWKESDVPEKQMGGIIGIRAQDGSGIAFISAYGIHEAAAMNDSAHSIWVTLFRSFRKTVMTNGEEGGQIAGNLKFKYRIALLGQETTNADLIRLQDNLQAGVKSIVLPSLQGIPAASPLSYLEISSSDVILSIVKRPEQSDSSNEMIVRLYNPSDHAAEAALTSFWEIDSVVEVNLNEEHIAVLSTEQSHTLKIALAAWKIKTYKFIIKRH